MQILRKAWNSVALFLLLIFCRPSAVWSQIDDLPPTEVRGYVTVHGCEVLPGDLLVRARPALPEDALRSLGAVGSRPFMVRATRTAVAGRHEYYFRGLQPRVPYRIGIKLGERSIRQCGKLLWNASDLPFIAGGKVPPRLDAYSIQSTIEVWGKAGSGRTRADWVGADALDFATSAAGTRTFRWRSSLPWVTGGQLQVSTEAFPRIGQPAYNPCGPTPDGPTGIIYTQDFTAVPGSWSSLTVDFSKLLAEGGRTGGGLYDGPAIDPNVLNAIKLGRPLYVRVLPTERRAGTLVPVCDPSRGGVPPEIILALIPILATNKPPAEPIFKTRKVYYDGPVIDYNHPNFNEVCYKFTADHPIPDLKNANEVWDWAAVQNSSLGFGSTAKKGFQFCVPNSWWKGDDDSWLESFVSGIGDVLSGFIDELGKLITLASEVWEDIQNKAVSAVAAGLTDLGLPCDDKCKAGLEMGLKVALATIGAPPQLPNFNELMDKGADYLAAQAGSQLGIPTELTDYASDKAQKFIKKAVNDMKSKPYGAKGLPEWLVPDLRFQPAILTLELYRIPYAKLPSQPGLVRASSLEFAGKFVQLPKNLPYYEIVYPPSPSPPYEPPPLVFPMVLEPNMYGLPQPWKDEPYVYDVGQKQLWMSMRWKKGLGCYHLLLTGLYPKGDHVFTLFESWFRPGPFTPCTP